jgi:very-short-patch-repair endonuclease
LTAREIAQKINADKKDVNSLLYGQLRSNFQQDSKYRWSPVSKSLKDPLTKATENVPDTPFSRLCQYYLSCISRDDDEGVSVFAANKFGDHDYAELDALPEISDERLFDTDSARRLLGRIRKDRGRLGLYLGYPSAVKHQKSKSGWQGYFLEPLLLFPIDMGSTPHEIPKLESGFPIFNRKALKRLTNSEHDSFLEELIQLEKELGLTDIEEVPELDELARRLEAIRPEWPWAEPIDPDSLNKEISIENINSEGIYNKAVLVVGERSPFTQGLEAELKQLSKINPSELENTALGDWINNKASYVIDSDEDPIIEVIPLNNEQRNAIRKAMTQKLSIVTGPPGTGKSQVVTNLLINSAWRGKQVLFASKNNKAVDVVEARVNNLGPRPILLRVGSGQYQNKLAEYLLSLLSSKASKDELEQFNESLEIHKKLSSKLKNIESEEQKLIELRNIVDKLDQLIEDIREDLSNEETKSLKNSNFSEIKSAGEDFYEHLNDADKSNKNLFLRLFWSFISDKRFNDLSASYEKFKIVSKNLIGATSNLKFDDASIESLFNYYSEVKTKLDKLEKYDQYLNALSELQRLKPLTELATNRANILDKFTDNAERLWKHWLLIQPTKISIEDRKTLHNYEALLRMVIDAGNEESLPKEIHSQYRSLFPKVAHLLSCWAVTSLSTRGRVPFEPGLFDLVIFDEASQCDIASALPLLYRAKRAVIIGDDKQLQHISGIPRGQDQQLLVKYNLVKDFSGWSYSFKSLFGLANAFTNPDNIIDLREHHRSHADIIEFSNNHFYEGKLRVATRYNNLKTPKNQDVGVRWINVAGKTVRPNSGSAFNEKEAGALLIAIKDLVLKNGYKGTIGVVTPFRAQANLIREMAANDEALSSSLASCDFLVDVVHKFQGDERDIIYFSPVVSKGIMPGALSFLRNNGNLFNVAITRARAQLIVVGDIVACTDSDVSYLSNFASYVSDLEKTKPKSNIDVDDLTDKYPMVSNPEQVSDWERLLYVSMYRTGIKAIPQYQVEKYTLDFALLEGSKMLNIEVDGERYHRNWDGELCRRDQIRNHRMMELGWNVLRFWVYEIRDDMDGCINRIKAWQASNN